MQLYKRKNITLNVILFQSLVPKEYFVFFYPCDDTTFSWIILPSPSFFKVMTIDHINQAHCIFIWLCRCHYFSSTTSWPIIPQKFHIWLEYNTESTIYLIQHNYPGSCIPGKYFYSLSFVAWQPNFKPLLHSLIALLTILLMQKYTTSSP